MGSSSSSPKYAIIDTEIIRFPPCEKYANTTEMEKAEQYTNEMFVLARKKVVEFDVYEKYGTLLDPETGGQMPYDKCMRKLRGNWGRLDDINNYVNYYIAWLGLNILH